MSLDAAIGGVRAAVENMTGLTRVYDDPPASLSEFPCAFVVAANGEMSDSGAGGIAFHTIAVEIYQAPNITAQAVDGAKVWPDRVPFFWILVVVLAIVPVAAHPPSVLLVIGLVYVASGPTMWLWRRIRKRNVGAPA